MLGVSMQAMPGVYALLLGSGVSRAASIPTGYEVTIDLIQRVAAAAGESWEPDPEAWFEARFGESPNYSLLLSHIAKRPAERAAILKAYFEPTPQDRADGIKSPTRAHRSIARLAAGGYVRVILTTNFDRLLEEALEEQAIRPVVISTPEATRGATPLQHNSCTVIKLHGDYLDPSIKNTAEELATYSRGLNRLIDRVLDEWGLVVCGWSAEWDIALRTALQRCQNHRYTTYWASRGAPGPFEQNLIGLRRAELMPIRDADTFFEDIERTVRDLAQRTATGIVTGPGTLTPQALFQDVEQLVADPQGRTRLRHLVRNQTSALVQAIADDRFPLSVPEAPVTASAIAERMEAYERLSSNAVASMSALALAGEEPEQLDLMRHMLKQLAERPLVGGVVVAVNLRLYPGLLTLYAAGLSAVAAKKYNTLWHLWATPIQEPHSSAETFAVIKLNPDAVLDGGVAQQLPSLDNPRYYAPLSEHLFKLLQEPLHDAVIAETEYDRIFDRYELLAALVNADLTRESHWPTVHIGRFGWKARNPGQFQVLSAIEGEMLSQGDEWPLFKVGAFDGELPRAQEALAKVVAIVSRLPWW
jgi:hypothetical protein